MLHYNSAPAIIIAIPTAIRSNLHTNEASLTSSCTRMKYRMTVEQIMRGMSTACRVVVAVSEVCAFRAYSIALRFIVASYVFIPAFRVNQALIFSAWETEGEAGGMRALEKMDPRKIG